VRAWRPIVWALWFAWSAAISAAITLSYDPDNQLWGSKLFAICAILAALTEWWNRRGKKLAEKVRGAVRNLGHRLVVAPAGGRS
jgi:hypothetical protein